ncbi:MAG: hypothetical protein Q7T56_01820 [Nocardioidaceae bacterium]|nr:hypothetical protein [Nocardioidaceae bacterium]
MTSPVPERGTLASVVSGLAVVVGMSAAGAAALLTVWLWVVPSEDTCATSAPLADGDRVAIEVEVAHTAGWQYVATTDVDGGYYSGPDREIAGESDEITVLAPGRHPAVVVKDGDALTMTVAGQDVPLTDVGRCSD